MGSECFHFHSSTVCYYVGQEISPFTASGTVAQDGWWLVLSRTTDLNPDLCSQVLRKLSHPGDWPRSPFHLLPGLCPFSLEGRPAQSLGQHFGDPVVGAGLAVGRLQPGWVGVSGGCGHASQ